LRNNGLLLLKPLLKSRFPINSKPKVLEFANFQRFFAALAARTIIERSMQVGYGQWNSTRDAKRGEINNLICLVETNFSSRLPNHWINEYILVQTLFYSTRK
jgi:hypothetical protein